MLRKLKSALIAPTIFMITGFILGGNANASPICGTLENCRSFRAHLHEKFVKEDSQHVRKILVSHLVLVNTRIEELLDQPDPEKRTTKTGAIFTRDRSNEKLNEAWRDPDGLIWGDIVRKDGGSIRYMVQSSKYMEEIGSPLPNGTLGAKEYCESIGARLPSKEEFTRLREYMGARAGTSKGYSAQVLPNLSGYVFWSSSVYPNYAYVAYDFNGSSGKIFFDFRYSGYAVRCVVGR